VSANLRRMTAAAAVRLTKEERLDSILEAAMEEFAVGGLHGTPVEAIAKRVGVSQPYLFQLFGTKKDLFLATLKEGHERILKAFMEATAEVPTDADAHAVLHELGKAYQVLLQDRTMLLVQMQGYAACDDSEVRKVVRDEFARIVRFVTRVSGATREELQTFFAKGMLMNVSAAMDLQSVKEDWARICEMEKH
jgi:AcrR family transcriptional regulator